VFVMHEADEVSVLSSLDLDDEQRAELRSAVGALIGLGVAAGDGAVVGAAMGASVDADTRSVDESRLPAFDDGGRRGWSASLPGGW
jgi:hypothetical protein